MVVGRDKMNRGMTKNNLVQDWHGTLSNANAKNDEAYAMGYILQVHKASKAVKTQDRHCAVWEGYKQTIRDGCRF